METAIAAVAEFSSNPEERLTNIRKFGAFNQGWFHGIWADDGNAGACCGFQCETCEVNPESKFWCGGIIKVWSPKRHLYFTIGSCSHLVYAFHKGCLTPFLLEILLYEGHLSWLISKLFSCTVSKPQGFCVDALRPLFEMP
jgi:hypothetical protein